MSISTYAELQEAVSRFAMRDGDDEFEPSVVDFISLAESKLNRALPLRVMQVDATTTGTIGSRLLGLPSDFLEPMSLRLTTFGPPRTLSALTPDEMPLHEASGVPTHWCVNAGSIQLDVPLDREHTFQFRYRKSFALSDASPTNWLLTNHPDVYLAACLTWGGVFMKDREEAATYKALLEEAIEEISWKDARSIAIAPLKTDPALSARGSFNIITG